MSCKDLSFDSGHADMVHDVQMDFYGKRMATASSDRTVKIFEVTADSQNLVADLTGHEGPVWQLSWAHPKFGTLLASCGFDHKVIVWQEQDGVWSQAYQIPDTLHTASINSVCFAPEELGLMLACGSSDQTISIIRHHQGKWETTKVGNDQPAHMIGVLAVSWAPAVPAGALCSAQGPGEPARRLVSCGCDNLIKIWTYNSETGTWVQEGSPLSMHTEWVRDVAWAPNLGLPMNTIASAGQDGKAIVWTEKPGGAWEPVVLRDFGVPVWRVSWSIVGNLLAVSDGNNMVTLWKEGVDGVWQCVSEQSAEGKLPESDNTASEPQPVAAATHAAPMAVQSDQSQIQTAAAPMYQATGATPMYQTQGSIPAPGFNAPPQSFVQPNAAAPAQGFMQTNAGAPAPGYMQPQNGVPPPGYVQQQSGAPGYMYPQAGGPPSGYRQ